MRRPPVTILLQPAIFGLTFDCKVCKFVPCAEPNRFAERSRRFLREPLLYFMKTNVEGAAKKASVGRFRA